MYQAENKPSRSPKSGETLTLAGPGNRRVLRRCCRVSVQSLLQTRVRYMQLRCIRQPPVAAVTLPRILSRPEFAPVAAFAVGSGSDESWRGALGIVQRRLPSADSEGVFPSGAGSMGVQWIGRASIRARGQSSEVNSVSLNSSSGNRRSCSRHSAGFAWRL